MIRYNPSKLRDAVQFLVDSSYAHLHVKKLRSAAKRPRTLPFTGEAEVLNELVVVGRQSLSAMEGLIELAASKHDRRGDYQREYMAAKRKRDRKVFQLEELMTGKTLSNEQRSNILKHQYEVWGREKDALLATIGDASWHDRNQRIRAFWDRKEAELDALIAEAREHGPIKRKYTVNVPKQPRSDFGKKLVTALDRR